MDGPYWLSPVKSRPSRGMRANSAGFAVPPPLNRKVHQGYGTARSCHAAAASVAPAGADAAVDGTVALSCRKACCHGSSGRVQRIGRPIPAAVMSGPSTSGRGSGGPPVFATFDALPLQGPAQMLDLPVSVGCSGHAMGAADSVAPGAVLPVPVLGRGADMVLRLSAPGLFRLTARRSGPSCRAPCPTCAKALDRNGPVTEARSQSQRAGARRRPVLSCLSPIKIIAAKLVQAGVLDHQSIGTGPDHHVAPDLACGAAHVAPAVEAGIG